jgi:signal transduction histidine kinase
MDRPVQAACANEPVLADAFAAFTAAAGRLEFSYQQLQSEVARLREELEQRNAALASSLAENEAMRVALGKILEALPCGVVVLDSGGEISFVNPETQRLFGGALGTAELSKRIHDVRARIEPNEPAEQEFCITVNRQKRWLVARCARTNEHHAGTDKNPELPDGQIVLIIRDVTAQREMEREREEARRLLALAEMSSVLAHEIRNPLASMELFAGLLAQSTSGSTEERSWVEHLQVGIRSLSATVNNVLRVHTAGAAALVPLRLSDLLREGVRFLAPLADQAGVTLSLHEELGVCEIAGNPGELQQIVINLALNAFRHTAAGGELTIIARKQARAAGAVAIIEFADTGCGISADHLPEVFEAGFSCSRQSPGLGLAVCRKIVQQHHGNITVESTLGRGTTFRMEFPTL